MRTVLPRETQAAWEAIVPLRPEGAYLVGGTAIAAHLAHRVSRDLGFFLSVPVDLKALSVRLAAAGNFIATTETSDTLNGIFLEAKVQFLLADTQTNIEPLTNIDGIPVASLPDLLAMKLKVVMNRGELRDYFDIMTIEQQTGLMTEEGLALLILRFRPSIPDQTVMTVVRALGAFDDVGDDPGLPVQRAEIERYWGSRQPQVVGHLDRTGESVPARLSPEIEELLVAGAMTKAWPSPHREPIAPGALAAASGAKQRCPERTRLGVQCKNELLPGSTCPAHGWRASTT